MELPKGTIVDILILSLFDGLLAENVFTADVDHVTKDGYVVVTPVDARPIKTLISKVIRIYKVPEDSPPWEEWPVIAPPEDPLCRF